ncbi:hypothetical protein [Sphingomonas hengshuiensis]|uniref:Uncharacterized protein n=1 Tax=Sphingomonas hengshuiensis TaxID=1609977 RepID=A0A7U5BE03_9SPHN|nr:hypothetical protein [Sphingomonas hengshuiensis]AJP70583.1 hypothetical protein TS85_00155 [Sphingomonas hengshuiensis]
MQRFSIQILNNGRARIISEHENSALFPAQDHLHDHCTRAPVLHCLKSVGGTQHSFVLSAARLKEWAALLSAHIQHLADLAIWTEVTSGRRRYVLEKQ